jgi:hypothetical protein
MFNCSNQELKSERIPHSLDCFNWLLHDFCNRGTSIKYGYAVVIVGNGCDLSYGLVALVGCMVQIIVRAIKGQL